MRKIELKIIGLSLYNILWNYRLIKTYSFASLSSFSHAFNLPPSFVYLSLEILLILENRSFPLYKISHC